AGLRLCHICLQTGGLRDRRWCRRAGWGPARGSDRVRQPGADALDALRRDHGHGDPGRHGQWLRAGARGHHPAVSRRNPIKLYRTLDALPRSHAPGDRVARQAWSLRPCAGSGGPAMTEPLLEVRRLVKRFGAVVATADLDLAIMPGELHAVIGPNGAGKTTLIGQLVGEVRPDAGHIYFAGRDITALSVPKRAALGLARSFQTSIISPGFSTLENVALAVQAQAGHSFRFGRPARSLTHIRHTAVEVLKNVGLAERVTVPAARLSHGEQRQLEIAMALAT